MSETMAKPGITKNDDLPLLQLPEGMGAAQTVGGSPHCYTGTVILQPGDAFGFHYHPNQTEYVYVLSGTLEAWVDRDKATIKPGDVMVAPPGVVHACFNTSQEPLSLIVIITPLVEGVEPDMELVDGHGWELIDVSSEEPWRSLRG